MWKWGDKNLRASLFGETLLKKREAVLEATEENGGDEGKPNTEDDASTLDNNKVTGIRFDLKDLKCAVGFITALEAGVVCRELDVTLDQTDWSEDEFNDFNLLLEKALSHPNCRPVSLCLRNHASVRLSGVRPLKLGLGLLMTENNRVRECRIGWSVEIPTFSLRREFLNSLSTALLHENCQITSLRLDGNFPLTVSDGMTDMLRRAVLDARSCITSIELSNTRLGSGTIRHLGDILLHSRIESFKLWNCFPMHDDKITMSGRRFTYSRLRRLRRWWLRGIFPSDPQNDLLDQLFDYLSRAIRAKNNRLSDVTIQLWPMHVSTAFVLSLKHPNCRVRRLHLNDWGAPNPQRLLIALADILSDPGCKLKHLKYAGSNHDTEALEAVARSIKRHNRLETLSLIENHPAIDLQSSRGTLALLHAIKESPNELHTLELLLPQRDGDVLDVLADCLLAPMNRIRTLQFLFAGNVLQVPYVLPAKLKRAVRISNLQRLNQIRPFNSFMKAFNEEWFMVLVALTSVQQIPRLGIESPLRVVPITSFIRIIAETLEWHLEKLQ